MRNKRLYNIWACMKQRCQNPKHTAAPWYYDKGIQVCSEWQTFEKFEKWALSNGYTDNLTIDRIDSQGNYEPSNCRWIPLRENLSRAICAPAKGKKEIKLTGNYEIVYRVIGLFEVVEERGYSYRMAIQRLRELEVNKKGSGIYSKRKIDRSKEVGKVYFITNNKTQKGGENREYEKDSKS